MGQYIAVIITREPVVVPELIVHFIERDLTIIVLDLGAHDVSFFIETASEFESFDLFTQSLKQNDFMHTDDEGESFQIEEWGFLINLIENLEMKSWAIEFCSEWAGMDDEHHFMPVINNKIIKEACIHRENDGDHSLIFSYKYKMNIDREWNNNDERYFNFHRANIPILTKYKPV